MRNIWKHGLVAASLALPGIARAGNASPWIHVQVHEDKDGGSKVNVNLPMSLVDFALDKIKDEHLQGGRIELGSKDIKVADLRRMWQDLRNAGDAELVNVEEKDQTVKIERRGDRLTVQVGDKKLGRDKVRVDVPTSVVDALFSSEGDDLDLKAAISELNRTTSGEFINIDDGDSRVRIWIDDRPGS